MQTLMYKRKRHGHEPREDAPPPGTISRKEEAFGRLQSEIGNTEVQRLVALQREPEAGVPAQAATPTAAERASAQELFGAADAKYRAREYEEALAGYLHAYELSREPLLLYNAAQCYRNLGQTEAAIDCYQRFVDTAGGAAGPFAAKAGEWIHRLRNPDAKSLFAAADAKYKAREYAAALEAYGKSFELSKEPLLLYNLGQCHRNLGNVHDAVRCYKEFLALAGENPFRAKAEKWLAELLPKIDTSLYEEYVAQFGAPS